MPVCSYVVFPATGRTADLARRLSELDGCQVEEAENRELLLLVTSTDSPEEDRALREKVEAERDIQALVMAFGEIDPETEEGDPIAAARNAESPGLGLPVLNGEVTPAPGPEGGRGRGDA